MSDTRDETKVYLSKHGIPQLFECLLCALILEKPPDPVIFIESKIVQLRSAAKHNINWESFLELMCPYRDRNKRHLSTKNRGIFQMIEDPVSEINIEFDTFKLTQSNQ
ncbi:hypothetical protein Ahia01_000582600, partial [Argonauta hians]